jgi:hypothetical protein
MSDERHAQQHQPVSGESMPMPAAPSTRMLTATKWTTMGIMALWIPLTIDGIVGVYSALEHIRRIGAEITGPSAVEASIARLEVVIVLLWATLGAVVLIGIAAFLAEPGKAWARIVCTVLTIFPVAAITQDAIRSTVWLLLIFLVPFLVLVVLWWLPGTSRGIRAVSAQGSVA